MVVLRGLLQGTMTDAALAERYKDTEKEEAKKIGQVIVVREMLEKNYEGLVKIKGQEDGRVKIFGQVGSEARVICKEREATDGRVVITDVAGTDVGCDFVLEVMLPADAKKVSQEVKQLTLAGVGFRTRIRRPEMDN